MQFPTGQIRHHKIGDKRIDRLAGYCDLSASTVRRCRLTDVRVDLTPTILVRSHRGPAQSAPDYAGPKPLTSTAMDVITGPSRIHERRPYCFPGLQIENRRPLGHDRSPLCVPRYLPLVDSEPSHPRRQHHFPEGRLPPDVSIGGLD